MLFYAIYNTYTKYHDILFWITLINLFQKLNLAGICQMVREYSSTEKIKKNDIA
ncbi:hypothetical protein DSBG_0119 [Desulfosporosinus sp. BG]|nr:hypothetical protein DSBG_0119 [Desulfosporosinus sp. BG]